MKQQLLEIQNKKFLHHTYKSLLLFLLGFLAQGDSPENFDDWLHSHKLLVLSPKHRWGSSSLGKKFLQV
jgi:hypothetical protein